MSAAPEDPFVAAQRDLLALLAQTKPLLTSYLRIRSTAPSPTSPELVDARRELEAALQELLADLTDLRESVSAAERDPYRFGLDVHEVARRRQLVADVSDEVAAMRAEVLRTAARAPAPASPTTPKKDGGGGLPDPRFFDQDEEQGDDDYAEFEQQRQQELLAEQDEQLDGVFRTVGNLRLQADTMGRELEEQGELLDSLDTTADRVGGKLQNGIKRIGNVVKANEDTWSSCCIGVLIVVLIILLVLVLLI